MGTDRELYFRNDRENNPADSLPPDSTNRTHGTSIVAVETIAPFHKTRMEIKAIGADFIVWCR
jgi:hypothetical protein